MDGPVTRALQKLDVEEAARGAGVRALARGLRRLWNPRLHPRDAEGRFAQKTLKVYRSTPEMNPSLARALGLDPGRPISRALRRGEADMASAVISPTWTGVSGKRAVETFARKYAGRYNENGAMIYSLPGRKGLYVRANAGGRSSVTIPSRPKGASRGISVHNHPTYVPLHYGDVNASVAKGARRALVVLPAGEVTGVPIKRGQPFLDLGAHQYTGRQQFWIERRRAAKDILDDLPLAAGPTDIQRKLHRLAVLSRSKLRAEGFPGAKKRMSPGAYRALARHQVLTDIRRAHARARRASGDRDEALRRTTERATEWLDSLSRIKNQPAMRAAARKPAHRRSQALHRYAKTMRRVPDSELLVSAAKGEARRLERLRKMRNRLGGPLLEAWSERDHPRDDWGRFRPKWTGMHVAAQSRKDPRAARFWSKVKVGGPNDVWEYQAARDKQGYGYFKEGKSARKAHIVAWELSRGRKFPKGGLIMHTTDRPSDVNPNHLILGTNRTNVRDMMRKRRHSYGAKTPTAKLTDGKVAEIRRKRAGGQGVRSLAREYGVSPKNVRRILAKQSWKHVVTEGRSGPVTRALQILEDAA